MYSNNIFEQIGGKTNSHGNTKTVSKTIDSYTPSDKSLSEQGSLSKLIKANRELKRDLDLAKDELIKVKKELEKANAKLKQYGK
tara:strand:- start:111 stop:362 length:252 start_codon:yes stop_codon:yes gene_type:complete